MTYRKLKTSDTWHWVKRCRHWPRRNFTEQTGKPKSGEKCNECMAKERAGK